MFLTFLFGSFHLLHCVCCSASSCFCFQPVAPLDFSQSIKVSNCDVVSLFISQSSDPPSLSSVCLLSHTAYASVLICVYHSTHASFFPYMGDTNFYSELCVWIYIHIIYKIGVWCEHIIYTAKLICQDKTVGKTQSWIESWISISSSPLKYFLLYICLENPRLIFYSFTPLFLLYKPEIPTKQTGLINRFVIPPRNLCTCVQKSKSKHDGGAHVFFLFPHVTHGIVRYLIPKEICTAKWKKKLPAKKKTIHSQKKKKKETAKEKRPSLFLFY